MATACRLAAPLGLAPLPRGRASAGVVVAVARCGSKRIPRGAAVRATSGGEGATEELPEIFKAAQDAWDKVEDKYAVAAIGVAAIVALWTTVGAIKVHDDDKHMPLTSFLFCLVSLRLLELAIQGGSHTVTSSSSQTGKL